MSAVLSHVNFQIFVPSSFSLKLLSFFLIQPAWKLVFTTKAIPVLDEVTEQKDFFLQKLHI